MIITFCRITKYHSTYPLFRIKFYKNICEICDCGWLDFELLRLIGGFEKLEDVFSHEGVSNTFFRLKLLFLVS